MTHTKNSDFVLAFEFYFENGWYGDRKRYILSFDTPFKTKSDANKHASMLKKFLKKEKNITVDPCKQIANIDDLPTYNYMGAGPSYACTNIMVDTEKFLAFVEKEKKEMAERSERRWYEKERAQNHKEGRKFLKDNGYVLKDGKWC